MAEHLTRGESIRDRALTKQVDQPGREAALVVEGTHPIEHERPEDWGWHGEMGKWGRRLVWLAIALMIAYNFGNHEGHVEDIWLGGITLVMLLIMVWDWWRRKNAWRAP